MGEKEVAKDKTHNRMLFLAPYPIIFGRKLIIVRSCRSKAPLRFFGRRPPVQYADELFEKSTLSMDIRPETLKLIEQIEIQANRKLYYPQEVAQLVDLARQSNKVEVLEDALFHAKFVTKSFGLMQRIGADGEGHDKLAVEFQASIEKTSTLLRTLVKESTDGVKGHFVQMFFSMSQESLAHFMNLLSDLTILKNWRVDGKPLP